MNSTTKLNIHPRTETQILQFLITFAGDNDLPLAFWRLPGDSVSYVVIANAYKQLAKDAALEDLPPGFMFAPYDRNKPCLFLPADYLFSFENNELKPAINPVEISSHAWLNSEIRKRPLRDDVQLKHRAAHTISPDVNIADFLSLVNKSIAETQKGTFEKIVPSRAKAVKLADDFDLIKTILNLKAQYDQALVSFVSIPGVGHWLGATPETLVSVEDNSIFKTVALAGTQPFREGTNLRNVTWTQKEIEEQALVERYVISCFKKIRVREYEEHGPKTAVAGNLMHLKSDFMVDMKAINFPQLGTVMLQLLHPTSAVCGMPLEPALEFLKLHEGYDREFYSGYLGPVQIKNNIHLFVNLRCMKLLDGKAILYAGAGVTVDSNPEQELEETEMKFRTLLNVIG